MKQIGFGFARCWIFLFLFCGFLLPVDIARGDTNAGLAWSEFTTPHFHLFTTGDSAAAVQALEVLERTYDVFADRSLFQAGPQPPATVIAFRSEAEYAAYRPQPGVSAWYQRSRNRDVIVLQDLTPENYPPAIHEYVHFLVAHSGRKLPLWLKEGIADVYSTVVFRRLGAVIGAAPSGRLESLQTGEALSLEALFSAGQRSVVYNSPAAAYRFYAESWALAHMLLLNEAYADGFPRFLSSISAGVPASECFRTVYGKTLEQVRADLSRDLQGGVLTRVLSSGSPRPPVMPERVPVLEVGIQAALANLLAANPARQLEAEERLAALSEQFPADPEPEESLGYLALRRNDTAQARIHFTKAVARNSKDADVLYQAARLEQAAGAPESEIISLLQRLLAVQPDNENGRLNLAVLAARTQDFALALSTLSAMPAISTGNAFTYFYTLAYCQARLKKFDAARKQGRQALNLATNADQQRQAEALVRYSELAFSNYGETGASSPVL